MMAKTNPRGTVEKPPDLDALQEKFRELPLEERRKQLQWVKARLPRMTNAQAADLFGVSEATIDTDRAALKQAAMERLSSDPDLQAELFAPLERFRDGAIEDILKVEASERNRPEFQKVALLAHEKLIDVMFRCGYVAEAPKRHEVTGADGGPLAFIIEQFGPEDHGGGSNGDHTEAAVD